MIILDLGQWCYSVCVFADPREEESQWLHKFARCGAAFPFPHWLSLSLFSREGLSLWRKFTDSKFVRPTFQFYFYMDYVCHHFSIKSTD